MEYKITKETSDRIELTRFIAIILVVVIHMSDINLKVGGTSVLEQPLWLVYIQYFVAQIIARSAVPVFFLISGVLLYRKDFEWKENNQKKVKSIVIPYMFWNTLWLILFLVFQSIPQFAIFFSNPDNQVKDFSILEWIDAYLAVFKRGKPFLYPLWFMKDLFILNVFSKIIQLIVDKFPRIVFSILFILYLFSINFGIVEIQSVFFFTCGYYIVKYRFYIEQLDCIKFSLLVLIYLSISSLLCFLEVLYNNFLVLHNLVILLGLVVILRGSYYLICMKKNKLFNIAIDSTFFIYVFHEWNLMILRKLFAKLLPQTAIIQLLEFFLLPLIIISISVIVSLILKCYLPRFYSLISGSR